MRTATIVAVTHDKKDKLVCGKTVPLPEQLKRFKELRAQAVSKGSHDEFAEVYYQETEGHEQRIRFNTPEKQKQVEAQRSKDEAAHKSALAKAQKLDDAKSAKPTETETK